MRSSHSERTVTAPPRYDDLPDMCTPEDVRQFLQVGRHTVYDLINRGDLPHIRFGKLIRIPKSALRPDANGALAEIGIVRGRVRMTAR